MEPLKIFSSQETEI